MAVQGTERKREGGRDIKTRIWTKKDHRSRGRSFSLTPPRRRSPSARAKAGINNDELVAQPPVRFLRSIMHGASP